MLMAIKFLPSDQISQLNSKPLSISLLDIITWIPKRALKLNLFKTELIFSHKLALHKTFPISACGDSIIHVVQAKPCHYH